MAESVVSPTPVFMGEINQGGWPRAVSSAATSILTDVATWQAVERNAHLNDIRADFRELRHNQSATAETLAAFRVSTAEKFAAIENSRLAEKVADMRAAQSDGLLNQILGKLVTPPAA